MTLLRQLAIDLLPPVLVRWLRQGSGTSICYEGEFATWERAASRCVGYDAPQIVEKVREALLAVKNGKAAAERDSVLFDRIEYSWPLLASLLWIASREGNRLNLVDFGGSLGSSYYQNRHFLMNLEELKWHIVEQPCFVSEGRRYFENEILRFHADISECLSLCRPKAVLLSSVLPYLEKPYVFLEKEVLGHFDYVIIDRTGFVAGDQDRLTVQRVPPTIYQASYPAWFLSEAKLLRLFSADYELKADFSCNDQANIPSYFKGFLFVRRSS